MKNALLVIAAIVIVWIVWGFLSHLVHWLLGSIIHLAMLALFCYAVYWVFKQLSRQKI